MKRELKERNNISLGHSYWGRKESGPQTDPLRHLGRSLVKDRTPRVAVDVQRCELSSRVFVCRPGELLKSNVFEKNIRRLI